MESHPGSQQVLKRDKAMEMKKGIPITEEIQALLI
jgi:hypothetical protein